MFLSAVILHIYLCNLLAYFLSCCLGKSFLKRHFCIQRNLDTTAKRIIHLLNKFLGTDQAVLAYISFKQ